MDVLLFQLVLAVCRRHRMPGERRIPLADITGRLENLSYRVDLLVRQTASLLQLTQQNFVPLLQRLAGNARRAESHYTGEDDQSQEQSTEKFQRLTSFELRCIT